jgi:site-specific DNA-methyltransferase (adenine-specific)
VSVTIHTGDCREVMRTLADASIDAVITDPPYGLGFMGKDWDRGVPGAEFWAEMFRVSKPGAHLLAFGGTRTHHRMMCAIEDAGWDLRDTIMWVYGSGFPKSHNLQDGRGTALKPAWEPIIMARKPLLGTVVANVERYGTGALNIDLCRIDTDEALRAGAGGIPCRHDEKVPRGRDGEKSALRRYGDAGGTNFAATPGPRGGDVRGRWPANVMHDGSDEVMKAFPDAPGQQGIAKDDGEATGNAVYGAMRNITNQPAPRVESDKSAARFFYCAKASRKDRNEGLEDMPERPSLKIDPTSAMARDGRRGSGTAQNHHPTVKPTELMRHLCRLVTPRGGTILDPFCGSGSTGKAAVLEWCNFIGIDLEAEYTAIAERRIAFAQRRAA